MKISSVLLMILVASMAAFLPAKSFADPQTDTLLNIATQARDSLGATISQMSSVPDEINQLYKQGSDETDALAQSASQQDIGSAKEHFLAAMKFFKETNDKINSLNSTATNDQQKAQVDELRGELVRLQHMGILLKSIAQQNNVTIDFTPFDQMLQTASQDLDSGNTDDASKQIKMANDFIITTHNTLTQVAQARISQRAKEFTERQIAQLNYNQSNNTQNNQNNPPPVPPANGTGQNSTVVLPPTQNAVPQQAPNLPPTGGNITVGSNPQEMVAELKKLVGQGKVDQAINLIKIIQAYQREKLAERESEISSQQAQNSTAVITPPPQNIPPPPQNNPPPVPPANTTNPAAGNNGTVHQPGQDQGDNTQAPVPTPPVQNTPAQVPPVTAPPENPPGNTTVDTQENNTQVPEPAQNGTQPAPAATPQGDQNSTVPTPPVPAPPHPQNGTQPGEHGPKPAIPAPQNNPGNPPTQNNQGNQPPQNDASTGKSHRQHGENTQPDQKGPNRGHQQDNGFPWLQPGKHHKD